MLWKKEDLHEVDWVKQQTKSALSSLQKEVLYTKNWNEVKFDVDTSLKYLKTLKDKKSYKEVMAQNAWTTVMAVQILLKNKGYNVGKIDGILRWSGKATSNTMEAIKRFQRDNWLKDDGAPGPDTIKKILAVYETWWWNGGWNETVEDEEKVKDLTKAEFEALCEKTSLTDDEVKQVVKYANKNDIETDLKLTSITDKQAEELWKAKDLWLNWLTSITDKQAEELWKVKESLCLDWLTSITDKQAEELWKVSALGLDWLTNITDKQAEELWKVSELLLDWLTSITDKQAEELWKVSELFLNWLTSITDKQAEELWKVSGISLNWLTSITDKQATELAKVKRYLFINKVILTPTQKEILKKHIS